MSRAIIKDTVSHIEGRPYTMFMYTRNDFTDQEWQEYIDFDKKMYLSIHKKDNGTSYETYKKLLVDIENEYDSKRWLVVDEDGTLVGRGFMWHLNETSDLYKENKETVNIYLDVDCDHRRMTIGRSLYKLMVDYAKALGKNMLQSSFSVEEGKCFADCNDFKIESERFLQELSVKDIDLDQLKTWAGGRRKILIVQDIPEDILEEYCQLYSKCGAMAPDYEGDFTASEQLTPKGLRLREAEFKERGILQYTAIAVEEDGRLSGMTELDYGEGNPKEVDQGLTGVLPSYRQQGIGRQLKSALLLHILRVNPQAETVHTANNHRNHGMLKINEALGFKKTLPHYLVTKRI